MMEFHIQVDDELGVATIRISGTVTADALRGAMEALTAHPGFHQGLGRVWDAREGDLSRLTRSDLGFVAEAARRLQLSHPDARVAFVVSRDLDFGIGRMFQAMETEGLPAAMALFRNVDEARSWVVDG